MPRLAQANIQDAFDTNVGNTVTVAGLVQLFLETAMVIAGIIMLFLIVGGGFALITGAGSGDAGKTAQGKKAVTSAIIGFIIILSAYWVIRFIEIIIGCTLISSAGTAC